VYAAREIKEEKKSERNEFRVFLRQTEGVRENAGKLRLSREEVERDEK
jgi:hypothetical protein